MVLDFANAKTQNHIIMCYSIWQLELDFNCAFLTQCTPENRAATKDTCHFSGKLFQQIIWYKRLNGSGKTATMHTICPTTG